MKRIYVILLSLLISYSSFSQKQFFADTLYRYFIGTQEPEATWKDTNYIDNTWLEGHRSIGYGEKDSTVLPQYTQSVYIRYPFTVDSGNVVLESSLLCDYDDGFIAYLNGVEILRVNMGKLGDAAPFNRLSDRSHEIIGTRGALEPLFGYYIDSVILHKALKVGKNILAVQVHNDSINGSDLAFNVYLYNLTNSKLDGYAGQWHVIKQTALDSTLLPIISIETGEMGIVSDTGKVVGHMTVYNNSKGSLNRLTDMPEIISEIGIKLRGNSTLQWPKKNYSVETRDGAGNNLDIPLLGLSTENDWVFNGPFADKSNARNMLAFSLGRDIMNDWSPNTKYFELIINGDFLGLYVLIESIKRDSNRVDLKKLKPTDISGNDITGGYVYKIDQKGFEVVYPKAEDIQTVQRNYMSTYYSAFANGANAKTENMFLDSALGFRNKMDEPSYIDYTIINELMKNADAYQYSVYMHKDRDDIDPKIHFGPIWDFDLSCGNINVQNANKTNGWQFNESVCKYLFQKGAFRDTNLVKSFRNRWFELRKTILDKDALNKRIDSIIAYAGDGLKRNYEVWPYDGKQMDIWGYKHPAKTYQEDIAMMKTYLSARIDWIDANIKTMYFNMPPKTSIIETMAENENIISFPNPFKNELQYSFFLQDGLTYEIEIYSTNSDKVYANTGKSIGLNYNTINTQVLTSGVYYIVVSSNGIRKFSQTIIKE